ANCRNSCTARCWSIWYRFFIATLSFFLAEKLTSVIMTGVESRYFLRTNGHPHWGYCKCPSTPSPPTGIQAEDEIGRRFPYARGTYGHLWELQPPTSAFEFFDRFVGLFKNSNIPVVTHRQLARKYVSLNVRDALIVWHTTCVCQAWIETVVRMFTDGEYI